jgi:hypothetical protein
VVRAIASPMVAQISAIAVEYGLYEGRFWLPRVRSMEGFGQAMFLRVPVKLEQIFTYPRVNGPDDMPPIVVPASAPGPMFPPDSLNPEAARAWRDSALAARRAVRAAERDSVAKGLKGRPLECSQGDTYSVARYRYEVRLPVLTRVPCDVDRLINSPDFTTSIYDDGEAVFGSDARDALINQALGMAAQAQLLMGLRSPTVTFGLPMTRYNRVEGFSTGVRAEQQLGGGYSAMGSVRLGLADLQPNVELRVERSNMSRSWRVGGHHRLVSAGDWGDPLSFGSSMSALLFGRDEGFYYRASGAEVGWTRERGVRWDLRLFGERQATAVQKTEFSLARGDFPANVVANEGWMTGGALRLLHSRGLDPNGFRVFTDLRLEGGLLDSAFGRGALDVTLTQGLGYRVASALTLAGGSSIGRLPAQRQWFLGGARTVRGQSPDTAQAGNAFWLARAELARGATGVRPTIFADIGWVGDRDRLQQVGRPMSGVGAGLSVLDGMLRMDVARGIFPRRQWRVDAYLEARF